MHYRRGSILPILAALASVGIVGSHPAAAQLPTQGVIEGTVFQDIVNRNSTRDPGEPTMVAVPVELWTTTSLTGQPVRIQSARTDLQGHYGFVVDALSGPRPDFGCYEVRLIFLNGMNREMVVRSQPVCRITAGGKQELDFALTGGDGIIPPLFPTIPPPVVENRPPAALYLHTDAGAAPGGVLRMEALAVDPEDDCLTYTWDASAGRFVSQEGPLVDWQAPTQPGQYRIQAQAADPTGGTVVSEVIVTVAQSPTVNHAPVLEEIIASDATPIPGQVVQLTARATDPDGDRLRNWFHFYNAAGTRVGPFDLLWKAPSTPGIYRTFGIVTDDRGGYGFNIRELSVNSAQALNRSHPSYGRAGQVLIDSYGRLLWVGINDPTVAQQAATVAATGESRWVLGRVVPDPSQRHCFYLDPGSVSLAEVTAEGIQTTVEQVSRRPAYYASGAGGFGAWAISGRLLEFVPAP